MSVEKMLDLQRQLEVLDLKHQNLLLELQNVETQYLSVDNELQELLSHPNNTSNEVVQKWLVWTKKPIRAYRDVANVEDYFQPPEAWRELKNTILAKKGYGAFDSRIFTWIWAEELAPYIHENGFNNPPLSEEKMRVAMSSIMEHNVMEHYEAGYAGDM